jgi:hypothetical protein
VLRLRSMRQNSALRRLQRLDRNGWHEISVEAQSICQAASLARCRRWQESWQTAFLAEDSPARRRLLTVRHRHAPASRRSCRGHVGQETRDYPKLFLLTVSRRSLGNTQFICPKCPCGGGSERVGIRVGHSLRRVALAIDHKDAPSIALSC